jgi:amidase
MSVFPEYDQYDGLGLAELIRTKQIKPVELIEAAIHRIELFNPQINAVVYKMYDQAIAQAKNDLPTGPFQGVPFLLKDLTTTYAGIPTSAGNRLLRHLPASQNSEIVNRWKAAGLVILGKTNTPEFGLTPYTECEIFGNTKNPWNLQRTPGGSSGGSAAAVAARMVPMASASDGGGSIRIPASCCGVFGLKPTRGRTPTGPDAGELWRGFGVINMVSRSVRDSAALLDAITGTDPGASYLSPPQAQPFLQEMTTPPGKLRIAFTTQPFLGSTVHNDCIEGLKTTVNLLQELGHEVIEVTPPIEGEAFAIAFLSIIAAEVRADIERASILGNCPPSIKNFEAGTYAMGLLGKSLAASDYAKAARYLQTSGRKIGQFFESYDLLLTPTLSKPPILIGSLQPSGLQKILIELIGTINADWLLRLLGIIKPLAKQVFNFAPYTAPFNITGQPAMSVPLYWNAEGLPIGMQFVSRFGDEATLFRLAGQLETVEPWSHRLPPLLS